MAVKDDWAGLNVYRNPFAVGIAVVFIVAILSYDSRSEPRRPSAVEAGEETASTRDGRCDGVGDANPIMTCRS